MDTVNNPERNVDISKKHKTINFLAEFKILMVAP